MGSSVNLFAISLMSALIIIDIAFVSSNCSRMILITEISGSARMTPPIPQKEPKNIKDNIATKGLIFTLLPTTFGVMKLPSTCCMIA